MLIVYMYLIVTEAQVLSATDSWYLTQWQCELCGGNCWSL